MNETRPYEQAIEQDRDLRKRLDSLDLPGALWLWIKFEMAYCLCFPDEPIIYSSPLAPRGPDGSVDGVDFMGLLRAWGQTRAAEAVRSWLDQHPPSGWCVIDDGEGGPRAIFVAKADYGTVTAKETPRDAVHDREDSSTALVGPLEVHWELIPSFLPGAGRSGNPPDEVVQQ